MRRFLFTVLFLLLSTDSFAQSLSSPGGMVVFETFGLGSAADATQAGVLAGVMTTQTMLFATSSTRFSRNVGVAIVNPGGTTANVTMTLRLGGDGTTISVQTIAVGAHKQVAEFTSQLFADVLFDDFDGSLAITSDNPVAIMGLRFLGSSFSTIPITSLSAPAPVPQIAPDVGGPEAVILPQFVTGGSWLSEIVILNTTAAPFAVRVDLFKQDGMPLTTSFNGQYGSSFQNIFVPAKGIRIESSDDTGVLQIGYAIVTPLATIAPTLTTAPIVTSTAPANGASGVALNARVVVTFSGAPDPLMTTTATFTLKQGATPIIGTFTYAGSTATFSPLNNFVPNTAYTATITTGLKDLADHALASSLAWNFTTGEAPNITAAPAVISVQPFDAATDVALNRTLSATFTAMMDQSTMTTTNFTVTGPGLTPVTGTVAYDAVNKIATFIPASNLISGTTFTATIRTGARDSAGNALATNFVWSFASQPLQISLVASLSLTGAFPSSQNVYADSERVYLCSYEGDLFVLARDRKTNFPLIQTIPLGSPLTAIRGDSNNLYVASRNGNLYVFSKTWPLQLLRSIPLSNYGLSALEVVGGNIYVAKGQAAMVVTENRLYLSPLNPGDFAIEIGSMRSYGYGGFAPGKTSVFDAQTQQQIGALPNPSQGGVNISAWASSIYLTNAGCCSAGVDIYDAATLTPIQHLNRPTNVVAGAQGGAMPLMVGGSETGDVELYALGRTGYQLVQSVDLPHTTGFTGPEDIEIRALWIDGIDNLVFAASSGGNTQSRSIGGLPTFFVLQIQ